MGLDLCQYGLYSIDIYKRSNILVFSGKDKNVKYKATTVQYGSWNDL